MRDVSKKNATDLKAAKVKEHSHSKVLQLAVAVTTRGNSQPLGESAKSSPDCNCKSRGLAGAFQFGTCSLGRVVDSW